MGSYGGARGRGAREGAKVQIMAAARTGKRARGGRPDGAASGTARTQRDQGRGGPGHC